MTENLLDRPTVYGARAKLGVIVPPTNTANEAEWNMMAPADVTVHSARMPLHSDTSSDAGKKALYDDISRYVKDLAQASVDVIAYGCTAGSMISPPDQLADFMAEQSGCKAVTTAQSIVRALRALGIGRVAVATPYHHALNEAEAAFLAAEGIETVSEKGLGYGAGGPHEYRNIARVRPDEVYAHALSVDVPEAQAILISCTDFATATIIEKLETETGKPVVTSNQSTFWLALRTAGIDDSVEGFGKLLREF